MHIIAGFLGSLITVLYLLDRLGIDLGGFNPFNWRRRRAWARRAQGDPIYSVEDPKHVAALLIVGAAKLDGEISSAQKKKILQQFESKFSLDSRAASELLGSASHLLGAPQVIDTQLTGLADRNKDKFSQDQAESIIQMMTEVVSIDGQSTAQQDEYIQSMRSRFLQARKNEKNWS